jgi:subtilisin family serine protease
VLAGLDWIAANRKLPAVANMSASGSFSQSLNDAVQRVINAGVVFTVAAGNNNLNACNYSPASAPNAITVAASMNTDVKAAFSNWGSCVDIWAPGYSIMSAWNTSDTQMGWASGTSQASPHAAGAAALYLETHPSALPAEVASAIKSGATMNELDSVGTGSPNALLHVSYVVSAPPPVSAPVNGAPSASFTASCSGTTCSVNASGSSDDAGIVSYSWTWGDGTSSPSASSAMNSHGYPKKGNYTVVLTVKDAAGLTGTAQKQVQVKNR